MMRNSLSAPAAQIGNSLAHGFESPRAQTSVNALRQPQGKRRAFDGTTFGDSLTHGLGMVADDWRERQPYDDLSLGLTPRGMLPSPYSGYFFHNFYS
jgi:hypothetical protein